MQLRYRLMEYLRCLVVLVLAASGCAESEFAADEQNKGKQTTHSRCAFLLLWKIVTAKKKTKLQMLLQKVISQNRRQHKRQYSRKDHLNNKTFEKLHCHQSATPIKVCILHALVTWRKSTRAEFDVNTLIFSVWWACQLHKLNWK